MTPTRVRVLIADDEPPALRRLATMVRGIPGFEVVAECADGEQAIAGIRSHEPDVAILDIQMPVNGFEVIRRLGEAMPVVIFVTAHDEHALAAFRHRVFDYLTKPVALVELRNSLLRAVRRGEEPRRKAIPVRTEQGTLLIDPDLIKRVVVDESYLVLHVVHGDAYRVRMTMSEFDELYGHPNLLRVHRSAMVDVRCIAAITPTPGGDFSIRMQDGTRVVSGRTYRDRVRELLDRR